MVALRQQVHMSWHIIRITDKLNAGVRPVKKIMQIEWRQKNVGKMNLFRSDGHQPRLSRNTVLRGSQDVYAVETRLVNESSLSCPQSELGVMVRTWEPRPRVEVKL